METRTSNKGNPMNLSAMTCSRELAEEMQRLGICQDEEELWYVPVKLFKKGYWKSSTSEYLLHEEDPPEHKGECIIAPTLSRMIEELPLASIISKDENKWCIVCKMGHISVSDKHLPNAVALAIIALKKGKEDGK